MLYEACRVGQEADTGEAGDAWNPDVNWAEVVERALHVRVAAHVHALVERRSSGVPASVRSQLAAVYHRQAADAVTIHEALKEILSALARASVPVVVLKGAAMATAVYQNVALRPMRDVDLLVRDRDLATAETAVRELGYEPDEWYQTRDWYVANLHHLVPLARAAGPAPVEIHHHLTPPAAGLSVPMDELWGRAQPVLVGGVPALALAPDDLLLHLCLHLTTEVPFFGGLGIVRDIAEVLRRHGPTLDGSRLLRTALQSGAGRHVYCALWLARQVTGAEVPDAILAAFRRSAGFTALGDRALEWLSAQALVPGARRGIIPEAFLVAWGKALLDDQGFLSRLTILAHAVYARGAQTGRTRRLGLLVPIYALFIHPFVVLGRFVTDHTTPRPPPLPTPDPGGIPPANERPHSTLRPRRADGVREYPMGDELLIYPPGGDAAHALNPSARAVWALCDGTRTTDDIANELAADLGRPPAEIAPDVALAIHRFRELALLAPE